MQTSSYTLSVRLRLPSAVGVWAGGPEPGRGVEAAVWGGVSGWGWCSISLVLTGIESSGKTKVRLNLLKHWRWKQCLHACILLLVMSDSFATLWRVACQVPLPMGFSRQENWSGLPSLPPGDLLNPGIKPASQCVSCIGRRVFFTISTTWEQCSVLLNCKGAAFYPCHRALGRFQADVVSGPR